MVSASEVRIRVIVEACGKVLQQDQIISETDLSEISPLPESWFSALPFELAEEMRRNERRKAFISALSGSIALSLTNALHKL